MRLPLEVLTMGRVGVEIYPLQVGVGHRAAVITRTGEDPFGRSSTRR